MELLIIKTGSRYIRVKPEGLITVNLDKASVFPMDRLDHVRDIADKAAESGFDAVTVKKLVLSEEDL
ncbi:MAG TPA: hypothetical protein DHV36_25140 [Desulfobacteraceae bacterium]|nr:hypothetical protein [Desulfobacteraceae bacterium]